MDGIMLLVLLLLGFIVVGSILGFVAAAKGRRHGRDIEMVSRRLRRLQADVDRLSELVAQQARRERVLFRAQASAPQPPPVVQAVPPAATEEEAKPAESVPAGVPVFGPAGDAAPPAAEAAPEAAPVPEEPVAAPSRRLDSEWWARFEQTVGSRWMTYLGGLALFVAVGFFIKYAIDNDLLGPEARVVGGLAFGLAILAAGEYFVRRDMRVLGLGLIGAAGLPILYVSLYAGFSYALIAQWAAFVAMIAVTVVGMVLAVRHDSLVVSFLALLGGLITPMLVSTGQDSRDVLFGYLMVLDLGVLGVALFRRWRAVDVLALVGTAVHFAGWFAAFYTDAAMVPVLVWLGAFYLTFVVLPFANHLRDATPTTLERFIMAVAVATAAFGLAHRILYPEHRHVLGFWTLGMAACYAGVGTLARKRIAADVRGAFAFLAFAMTFLTVSAPLHLGLNGITLAWGAEAVLLLYLGFRFAYLPVRLGGGVVLALAVGRLFARHWPLHPEPFALLGSPQFGVAAFVCLAAGAFAVVHHRWRAQAGILDALLKLLTGLGAGVLGLVVLHAEVGSWFAHRAAQYAASPVYLSRSAGAVVWALGSLAFLGVGFRARSVGSRLTGVAALVAAGCLSASIYEDGLVGTWLHFRNARFGAALVAVAAAFAHGLALRRAREAVLDEERRIGEWVCLAAGAGLLLALTWDLGGWLGQWSRYHARCGLAALWALGSAAFLVAGIRGRSRAWRAAGLIVLLVAVVRGAALYQAGLLATWRHFWNARFAVSLLLAATLFAHGLLLQRFRESLPERSRRLGEWLSVAAGLGLLLALNVELYRWLALRGRYEAGSGIAALWALGSAGFLFAGIRARSRVSRVAGVSVLAIACVLASRLFEAGLVGQFTLVVNLRFATCLLVVGLLFVFGRVLRRCREVCSADEQKFALFLSWAAGVLLLAILSADAHLYARESVAGAKEARWSSQMALSITWSVYAVVLLVVGFWRRLRAVRLAALGLFLVTLVKLALVDLAILRQQEIYRILSFFVVGLLMIGTSYLYHRVEKHLEKHWESRE